MIEFLSFIWAWTSLKWREQWRVVVLWTALATIALCGLVVLLTWGVEPQP